MSNPAAIAAVTATLRNLLTEAVSADPDLVDATVTVQALDRARVNGNSANQLNLFLYHVAPSAAWRNRPYPGSARPGESSGSVLGLDLHYLITAFGRDNDTQRPFSHQLIGRAMSTLNDNPLLGSDQIKAALPGNDLWAQVERVRLTLQPLSADEIAKLWTGFQTQYRLSIAYEAAVVLIESARPVTTPLPVLTRGPADRGVAAQSNVQSPFPTIDTLSLPGQETVAEIGDTVTLAGRNLSGDTVAVQLTNPRVAAPVALAAAPASDVEGVTFTIPDSANGLPPGLYTVTAVVGKTGETGRTSNGMPLAIAPRITTKLPLAVARVGGTATVGLTCTPIVLLDQRASLLLGSREVAAESRDGETGALTFVIPDAAAGEYLIRLRVDGVDSRLVDRSTVPPTFVATRKVSIT